MAAIGGPGSDRGRRGEEALLQRLQSADLSNGKRIGLLVDLRLTATDASLPLLEESLRSPDARIRRVALMALARVGSASAIEVICEALERGEEHTVGFAALELADMRSSQAHERILDYANRDSTNVAGAGRTILLKAVARLGDRRAAPIFVRHLTDPDRMTRRVAARALLRMNPPGAREEVGAAAAELSWFAAGPLRRALRKV